MSKIKVYAFACKLHSWEDAENIQQQLSLSHEHRNKLTEIILASRKEHRDQIRAHCGVDLEKIEKEQSELLEQISATKEEINQWKIHQRTRKTDPDLASRLKELRANLRPVKEALKAIKIKAREDPVLKPLLGTCDADVDLKIKEVRKHYSRERGIYWPNYLRNEESANKARYGPFDPKFRRWTGEGTVAIQLQRGLSVSELFSGDDNRLRFIAPPGFTEIDSAKTIRGAAKRIKALWRVASDEEKNPVWIELDVFMHRMLAPEARIKWAILKREKAVRAEGRAPLSLLKDYRYTIGLVTETPEEANSRKEKTVAVRAGWKMIESTLQVAVALGSDGKSFQLLLPNRWLANRLKVQYLSSVIDLETNRTVEALKEAFPAIFSAEIDTSDLLAPITEETSKVLNEATQGGNAKRIANALLRVYRFDSVMQLVLEEWRKKHLHLLRYKQGLNKRTLRARREIYRLFVSRLASRYSNFAMKNFDLRTLARKDLAKDQAAQEVVWQRSAAAISMLRGLLAQKLKPVEDPDLLLVCERLGAAKKTRGARTT